MKVLLLVLALSWAGANPVAKIEKDTPAVEQPTINEEWLEGNEKSQVHVSYEELPEVQEDLSVLSEVRGTDVVEAVEERIQESGVFPEDQGLFRRIAFVETGDGEDFKTYREGYHGGIWQVDHDMFVATKSLSAELLALIQAKFGINWAEVQWEDLRHPLHSAIAARLFLTLQAGDDVHHIPESPQDQAAFWAQYFRKHGDTRHFLGEVERLGFGFCSRRNGPLENLPYNSGKWLNIFVDKKIRCFGRVTQWEFYAKKRGHVFLSVWRPVKTNSGEIGWTRVGKNLLRVRQRGVRLFHIPRENQIRVRPGDVLGISYPREDPEQDDPVYRGIIPYQNSDNFPWGTLGSVHSDFSRIHNRKLFDEDINENRPRTGVRDFKRFVALTAHVNKRLPCFPNPCQNGGTCSIDDDNVDGGEDYQCECPPGFVGKDCEHEEECSIVGGPIENLAYDSGIWLNVFVDYAFGCSGRIVEWRFYAKERGTVFLTAFRPGGGGWTLIGKNEIRVRERGEHAVFIDEADQIEVKAGDVFGLHYPDEAANDPEDDRGIIPYCDTRSGGAGCDIPVERLSRIHNVNVQDSHIEDNPFRTGLRDFVRAVAVSAHVYNPMCGLQLGPRIHLPYDSGQWLNIFLNKPVPCSGEIAHFEFFAKKTGQLYLNAFRGNDEDGYRLLGKTLVTVSETGAHVIDLEGDQQIAVREGDVVGLHYPDRPDGEDDRGIIPYQNSDEFPWGMDDGEDYPELKIHNVDIQDSTVSDDYVAKGHRFFNRIPAFAVYINKDDETIKL